MDEQTKIIPMNKKILMELRDIEDGSIIQLTDKAKNSVGNMRLIVVDKASDCSETVKIGDEIICSNISALGAFKHGKEGKEYLMIHEDNVNAVIR